MTPLVVLLMGSRSDLGHVTKIDEALHALGIESSRHIASAHKSPRRLLDILSDYEAEARPKVYITVAGRSNALSGMVDAQVAGPVIACPPYSDKYGGADVYSSLRMPSGVAPAVVLEPAGAALLAAKMLGLSDRRIREAVQQLQVQNRRRLEDDDQELRSD